MLMFKHLTIPTVLHVCECGLVASMADRIKLFDTHIMLREMYHISDIREVCVPHLCIFVDDVRVYSLLCVYEVDLRLIYTLDLIRLSNTSGLCNTM